MLNLPPFPAASLLLYLPRDLRKYSAGFAASDAAARIRSTSRPKLTWPDSVDDRRLR